MIDEVRTALEAYQLRWDGLMAARADKSFFKSLKPVSVGWKVADKAEYDQKYEELRLQCDKIVETWMNNRWIAKMHLKESALPGGIEIIKLMQRRPGSDDAPGLDHVDFYSPLVEDAEAVLKHELELKWTNETNDAVEGYGWVSIWFDQTEAKLKSSTVLDIVSQELLELNKHIKA